MAYPLNHQRQFNIHEIMNLSSRIPASIFALLLGLFLVGITYYAIRHYDERLEASLRELKSISTLKSQQLAQWRIDKIASGESIASSYLPKRVEQWLTEGLPSNKKQAQIKNRLSTLLDIHHYTAAFIFDHNGNNLISVSRDGNIENYLEEAIQHTNTQNKQQVELDELHPSGVDSWHMAMRVPLISDDKLVGNLILLIDPFHQLFPSFTARTGSMDDKELTLFQQSPEGYTLHACACSDSPLEIGSFTPFSSQSTFQQPLTAGGGAITWSDPQGRKLVSYLEPVEYSPWFVVSTIKRTAILLPIYRNVAWLALFGLLILLSAAGLLIQWWRQQQTRGLIANEEQMKLVLDGGDLATWDWLLDNSNSITSEIFGHITFNDRFAIMLGYSPEELELDQKQSLRQWWLDQVHIDDLPLLLGSLGRHLEGSLPRFEIDYRLRHKKGHWIWVYSHGKIVERNPAGEPIRLSGVLRDITSRKSMELDLSEERERTRHYLDIVDVLVVVIDTRGITYLINHTGCQQLGYDEEQLLGKSWINTVIPEASQQTVKSIFETFINDNNEQVSPYEAPLITRSGEERLYSWRNRILHDSNGTITGILSAGSDITDQRAAERELKSSQQLFSQFMENLNASAFIRDGSEHFIYANLHMQQLFNQDVEGKHITDLFPPSVIPYKAEKAREAKEKGSIVFKDIVPVGNLGEKTFQTSLFVIKQPDGEEFLGGIALDITELQQAEQALREEEERVRLLFDSTAESIYGLDNKGICIFVNAACVEMLGYEHADELLGQPIHPLIHHSHANGNHYPANECRALKTRTTGDKVHIDDEVFWRKDGSSFPVEYWSNPIVKNGEITGAVVAFLDISQRRQSELYLHQAAAVFESTKEGVMISDANKTIVAANRAFSEITGYSVPETIGQSTHLLNSGHHDGDYYRQMWASISESGHWQGEIWNRRKNGELYPEWLTISCVRDKAGEVTNFVGVFSDISHIKQSEQKLEHLAHYDPLTDLPNRLLLNDRIGHALDRAQRHHTMMALLFIDLDRFKNVNDSLGHPAGDSLLQEFSQRLLKTIRQEDTVARLGGDEFVILLEQIDSASDAARVAQDVLNSLNKPFQLDSAEIFIDSSIGISLYPDDGQDATQWVKNADAAMYAAKDSGRNTYRFYTTKLSDAVNERLKVETQLRHALERKELTLYYQPQISLSSGRIVGAEALVRWNHPEEGTIPPLRFIPIAEETGQIIPLGEWVLHHACNQAKAWQDMGLPPITMAVNLSPRQFNQRNLLQTIETTLAESGLAPHYLDLEITESAIMEHGEESTELLSSLKELGIHQSIDDFGTGYSSLAYLKRFDIDKLKIDKSFVDGTPDNSGDNEIVTMIIAMARNLKMQVLAEGVENEQQLEFLRQQGCDTYQGYLFSPPVPAEEFAELLSSQEDTKG